MIRLRELYFAITSSQDIRVLNNLETDYKILVSAGSFWTGSKLRLPRFLLKRPEKVRDIFVDSGAQQFSHKFLQYPYSTKYYASFAEDIHADFIASLDVPLDIFEARKERYDYRKMLEITVQNAIELYELWRKSDMHAIPVLVIQGYRPHQFLECLDMYKEQGLTKHGRWAIGSLCMQRSIDTIYRVCYYIRHRLKGKWIHVFGPSVRSWLRISHLVDSVDTSMWRPLRHKGTTIFPKLSRLGSKQFQKGDVKDWEALYLEQARRLINRLIRPKHAKLTDFL